MLECLLKNTSLADVAMSVGFFAVYYGVGTYVLHREIELLKESAAKAGRRWDGLSKFSVFKMVIFFPLQIWFAKKRVEEE